MDVAELFLLKKEKRALWHLKQSGNDETSRTDLHWKKLSMLIQPALWICLCNSAK